MNVTAVDKKRGVCHFWNQSDEMTLCGLTSFDLSVYSHAINDWRYTTCKKCLKQKEKKR